MILPSDFPHRFFNPLTSKHQEDYIHVLLSIEHVLEQSKRIALPRNMLMAELRRAFRRENYALDVSDEEDYDEETTDDPEHDNLAYTIRLFLKSGWIDTDESGDHLTESVFLTQYGKKLTVFLNDLSRTEDQSGHVVNTFSNLQQIRNMPENGLICIQNAYASTQRLLTNIEVMYARIKRYYAALLENTSPETLLAGHLQGYVKDVIDQLIFPIKVDDSVDRFKGPILNLISDLESDTHLLEQIISFAVQTRRVPSADEGWAELLKMLNYINYNFDDIESYVQQLDEKNQNYIRITRQKLSYMLSMDTSIKGDIIEILRDAKDRDSASEMDLSQCFHLFDVKQITESSFYHPRKKYVRSSAEEIGIDEPPEVDSDELDDFFRTPAARYTNAKIYAHVSELLRETGQFTAKDYPLRDDHDYLTRSGPPCPYRIVHTGSILTEHPEVKPNSLAKVVSSSHPAARKYADFLLGRVERVDEIRSASGRRIAVTDDGTTTATEIPSSAPTSPARNGRNPMRRSNPSVWTSIRRR